uniref:Uncharacterized protein n=1 Tax=Candidatus Kentrum sp. UNK TaxID=2126344 RepID=A0A451A2V5_9GAMM|nr:MAG: hypothetical protein BECKUNK1418G_GA0071005_101120 [Candidatus Kentron sp. UNK]VFK69227.1 MAG: hypothetical protein BECKUNK1418H_GA0071006_101220 [Candidatus Kentron sp. UNK]
MAQSRTVRPIGPVTGREREIWQGFASNTILTYRKNRNSEKPGREIKAHPPSILARSANMFSKNTISGPQAGIICFRREARLSILTGIDNPFHMGLDECPRRHLRGEHETILPLGTK